MYWLARVKEVVDYCVSNDVYAILNIHWDGGWLETNPTYAKQEEVKMDVIKHHLKYATKNG
jgi:endoglucanase